MAELQRDPQLNFWRAHCQVQPADLSWSKPFKEATKQDSTIIWGEKLHSQQAFVLAEGEGVMEFPLLGGGNKKNPSSHVEFPSTLMVQREAKSTADRNNGVAATTRPVIQ